MKRMALVFVGAMIASAAAFAQSSTAVDTALLAAPGNLRDGATVIKWNQSNQTYETLRKGTNRLVCYDRSGFPEQQPFSVMIIDDGCHRSLTMRGPQ